MRGGLGKASEPKQQPAGAYPFFTIASHIPTFTFIYPVLLFRPNPNKLSLMKLLLLLLLPQVAIDTTRAVPLPPVVITATRSMRAVSDVPVPVQLVPAEAIRRSGAARLSDVLAEQPGLLLFEDHGTGLMIQGFEPDYTLLLLDGEPVIGRTAGTLDLKRFTVQGLDRIEIVRGPTSSLYGSEALAGVVNLIRHRPEAPMATTLHARMERFGTYQLGATSELRRNRLGATLLLDHYRTEGYDLAPEVFGPTAPALRDYTADTYLTWDLPRSALLSVAARYHQQQQQSTFAIDNAPHAETYRQKNWSLHPRLQQQLTSRLRLDASLYLTGYETHTRITRQHDASPPGRPWSPPRRPGGWTRSTARHGAEEPRRTSEGQRTDVVELLVDTGDVGLGAHRDLGGVEPVALGDGDLDRPRHRGLLHQQQEQAQSADHEEADQRQDHGPGGDRLPYRGHVVDRPRASPQRKRPDRRDHRVLGDGDVAEHGDRLFGDGGQRSGVAAGGVVRRERSREGAALVPGAGGALAAVRVGIVAHARILADSAGNGTGGAEIRPEWPGSASCPAG